MEDQVHLSWWYQSHLPLPPPPNLNLTTYSGQLYPAAESPACSGQVHLSAHTSWLVLTTGPTSVTMWNCFTNGPITPQVTPAGFTHPEGDGDKGWTSGCFISSSGASPQPAVRYPNIANRPRRWASAWTASALDSWSSSSPTSPIRLTSASSPLGADLIKYGLHVKYC